MELMREMLGKFMATHRKVGGDDKKTQKARSVMGEEFLKLRLPAIMIDGMVRKLREVVNTLRNHERHIMDLAIKRGRMPRKDFIRAWDGNQTNTGWVDEVLKRKQKWSSGLRDVREQLSVRQRSRLQLVLDGQRPESQAFVYSPQLPKATSEGIDRAISEAKRNGQVP
jgi:RNA polymerase primary sigma factor